MARISDAIGYDVEVSEPNGPTVHGYITDRWANSRQPLPVKPRREFADAHRFPSDWIMFRRDDGTGATVSDMLRAVADRG